MIVITTNALVVPQQKSRGIEDVLNNMKDDGQIALAGVGSGLKDLHDDITSNIKPPIPLPDLIKNIKP